MDCPAVPQTSGCPYDEPDRGSDGAPRSGRGLMAMAEALATGSPAVCFASEGPGVAHLAAPLLESLAACAPVIALSPGVDRRKDGKGAFQETDQVGLLKPVTKWAVSVTNPEKIPWVIHRAFSLATNASPGQFTLKFPATWAGLRWKFRTMSRLSGTCAAWAIPS